MYMALGFTICCKSMLFSALCLLAITFQVIQWFMEEEQQQPVTSSISATTQKISLSFHPRVSFFQSSLRGPGGFPKLSDFPLCPSLFCMTLVQKVFYLSSSQPPSAHYKGLSLCLSFAINGKRDSWTQTRWLIEHDEAPYQHNQRAKRAYISYFFSILCVIDLRVLGSGNNPFAHLKIPKR